MSESNKTVVRRFYEAANNRDLAALDQVVAADVSFHGMEVSGLEQLKEKMGEEIFVGFPDARITLEDLVAEGDRVVVRLAFTGTHAAEFEGMPATGRPIDVPEADIFRIEDGKIAEGWQFYDRLGLLMQLGLFPENSAVD